jgi:hypothetical protein
MKPKTLSKIISFYFILTFAFLGGIGSVMNMPNKLIPDLDYFIEDNVVKSAPAPLPAPTENYPGNKSMPGYKNKPMAPPIESLTPPPVDFYKDPNFYFKSTVGGVVGYILRYILDFISIGLRALAGKIF